MHNLTLTESFANTGINKNYIYISIDDDFCNKYLEECPSNESDQEIQENQIVNNDFCNKYLEECGIEKPETISSPVINRVNNTKINESNGSSIEGNRTDDTTIPKHSIISTFNTIESSLPTFSSPSGIDFDANRNVIIVADTGNNRILVMDSLSGQLKAELEEIPANRPLNGSLQLNTPKGIASDSQGNILISDTGNNRIVKFIREGNMWGAISEGGGKAFNRPTGIAADQNNNIYIADTGNSRIVKLSSEGTFLGSLKNSSELMEFDQPYDITLDSIGNIFVTDIGKNRVIKIDTTGNPTVIGSNSTERTLGDNISSSIIADPRGISTDTDGNVYISDFSDQTVKVFSNDGTFITSIISEQNPFNPDGLAVDDRGRLFVTDNQNNSIGVFGID